MFLMFFSISDDMIMIRQICLEENSSIGRQVVHAFHKTFRITEVMHLSQHGWDQQ